MNPKSISGVLLAYHEEAIVAETVARLQEQLEKLTGDWEIVVVGYAGCRDRTNEIVTELGRREPRIRLVLQPVEEKGYGRAFSLGLAAATKEWIFQSDADGQYDLSQLPALLELAADDVAFVHGYRAPRKDPFERTVFAFFYNCALKCLYAIPVRDADSAFKLMRRSAIADLPLSARSGFCIAQMIILLRRKRRRIVQRPVVHLPRRAGEALAEKGTPNPLGLELPSLSLACGTLWEMFRFRFR